jgi:DNA-binding transcriptional regulator YhcF (GntR family)
MPRKQPKLRFETLKGRAQQIVTRLTNAIAFKNRDCCSVDDFAEEFHTTPGRIKVTLQRLEDAGLVKIHGELMEQVVPTAKLLKHQDHRLSENQAARLIGEFKRGKYR